MSSKILAIGVAMLGLAVAAPAEAPWGSWPPSQSTANVQAAAPSATASGAQIKSGNPFSFPLDNGFPNLSDAAKAQVEVVAHGREPDGPAPTLKSDDVTSFQLIAFNELFEVAFFTDLIFNITNNVAGFTFEDQTSRTTVLNALVAIQAQEELHADNANAIVSGNGLAAVQPCQYQFPTTDLEGALALASTFTDVVLGTLQDIQLRLATNGDAGPVPIIGSVIGQEGEQNGFFRSYIGKIPSAKPFLTRSSREFAFSALNQDFVVKGSCPNINTIQLPPPFLALSVDTPAPIEPKDQLLNFSVTVDKASPPSGLSLVLINGQNAPIVETVQNAQVTNGVATFQANFPYTANVLDGFTIAALTNSSGPFTDAEDVAKATIAGPGLIEVN